MPKSKTIHFEQWHKITMNLRAELFILTASNHVSPQYAFRHASYTCMFWIYGYHSIERWWKYAFSILVKTNDSHCHLFLLCSMQVCMSAVLDTPQKGYCLTVCIIYIEWVWYPLINILSSHCADTFHRRRSWSQTSHSSKVLNSINLSFCLWPKWKNSISREINNYSNL